MDIVLFLLFIAIAYIAPKSLGKLQKQYGVAIGNPPGNLLGGETANKDTTVAVREEMTYIPSAVEEKHAVTVSGAIGKTPISTVEEKQAWQGKVDANALINGVIFAEIIQPPRAYRPFIRRK